MLYMVSSGEGGHKQAWLSFLFAHYKSNIFARGTGRGDSVAAAGEVTVEAARGMLWKREMCFLHLWA